MKLAMPLLLLALVTPLSAQSKAWLGATLEVVEKEEATKIGIEGGLKVNAVAEESPAQAAGLEAGDIILSAGEHTVTTIEKMREVLGGMRPGDFLSLGVRRTNGRNEPLLVTLGTAPGKEEGFGDDARVKELREKLRDVEREARLLWEQLQERLDQLRSGKADKESQPPAEPNEPPPPEPKTIEPERVELKVTIGATCKTLEPEEAKELGVQAGIRVSLVVAAGPAAEGGLQKDDIITHIDEDTVTGTGDLRTILARHQAGDRIELTVLRGSEKKKITVMLRAK